MFDRKAFRLPAALLLGGFVTYVVVTFLHTGGPATTTRSSSVTTRAVTTGRPCIWVSSPAWQ
jgi:hypothetical protein